MDPLVLAHAAAVLPLVGLIWFVQVVHYPLLAVGGEPGFTARHAEHSRRTTWVVAVPMLVQLATAAALVAVPPEAVGRGLPVAALALSVAVFAHTGLVAVPLHRRLGTGFDQRTADLLVVRNWPRTALWTAHGGVVLALLTAAG